MENINVQNIDYIEVPENQEYTPKDSSILNSVFITRNFGLEIDYIENHVYSPSEELLASNYNFIDYTVENTFEDTDTYNQMLFTPEEDVKKQGIGQGAVNSIYYFYRKLFSSSPSQKFIVKSISTDRTELRVILPSVSVDDLQLDFISWSNNVNAKNYYSDFVLNFSNNVTLIGVNVAFEQSVIPTLLIKLYEALPPFIETNDTFWLVDEVSDPITFEVTIEQEFINVIDAITLRGPNITIDIEDSPNLTTPKLSLDQLRNTEVSSSFQQLISMLDETSAEINIEYANSNGSTAFENFVHFSSAEERLTNFRYKLSLIEGYQSDVNALNNVAAIPFISQSKYNIQVKIDEIIKNFDNYEYYLYYDSSSTSWPKQNTDQPYLLYPVTSSTASTWFGDSTYGSQYYGGQILSASVYDQQNPNYVWNTMPIYVSSDPQNQIVQLFISMLGQHYDYLWTYVKAITDIQSGDNRLYHGVSKDLVAAALHSFGIKLYTTNRNNEDIYTALLGITPSGSLLPGNVTFNYPVTTSGSLLITEYVTASAQTTPDSDIVKETYKRLYHNLPYLLKTKGTYNGLRALMNCFGIPETILHIDEYGGSNKDTDNTEQYFERFAYQTTFENNTGNINVPWLPSLAQYIDTGDPSVMPDAIEFRFKTPGIPISASFSEPVFQVGSGTNFRFGIQLNYSQSYNNYVSGTITSPASPYYNERLGGNFQEYGLMRLVMSGSQGYNYSEPIYLPLFNGNWWSILLYRETGSLGTYGNVISNTYSLVVKNSIYTGEDGTSIGFQASSSIHVNGAISSSYNNSWNYYNATPVVSSSQIPLDAYLGGTGSNSILAPNGISFSGSFQDLRYWRKELGISSFNTHVLNPMSIQNNQSSGSDDSYNDLIFRLGLGNDLQSVPDGFNYTGSAYGVDPYGNAYYVTASYTSSLSYLQSTHPSITGSVTPTASFIFPHNPSSYNADLYNVGIFDSITSGSPTGIYNGTYYSGSYYTGSTTQSLFTFSFGRNISGSTGNTSYYALLNGPNVGAITAVNKKVRVIEQNLVTGSTLSPFITITQPQLDPYTPDAPYVDVSLSPQNSIDYDIINQLGYWNIDEYIGDPKEAASPEYKVLANFRNYYFKKYVQKYNIYEIVRLLGYFDNSIFKMIKDWVPGRASLAAGVLIRPHILERVKFQRFEPDCYTGSYYTGSIDMVDISASYGYQEDRITFDYNYTTAAPSNPSILATNPFTTESGIYIYEVTDQRSPYNGQYGGSEIIVYTQPKTNQVKEVNNLDFLDMPYIDQGPTAVTYSVLPFQPELNVVQNNRVTNKQLDVDYSSNPNVAVNNYYITQRFSTSTPGYAPFLDAPVQDSNYSQYASIQSRYNGVKLIAQQYNTYSVGDISYGSSPVVSKNSIYFAYFKEVIGSGSCMAITSSTLPYVSNVYLKYLIDAQSNVLELTKQNKNIFSIQEIYNNQQTVISLFNNQQPSNQKFLDGIKNIYAGGFKYTPVLYNPYGTSPLIYPLTASVVIQVPAAGESGIASASVASSFVLVPATPTISSSVTYGPFTAGTPPYSLYGYNYAFSNYYPSFTVQRTGSLLTTYLNDAINVYIGFTASFSMQAYIDSSGGSDPSISIYGWETYDVNQSSGSSFAQAYGKFYGDISFIIPAGDGSQLSYTASPLTVGVYPDAPYNLVSSVNAGSGNTSGNAVGFYNGGASGNAVSRQATSQVTQIISGALDYGYGGDTFFIRNTSSYNIITGSATMSYWYGSFIQSQSSAMIAGGYELIDTPFIIQKGDLFRFFDDESNQWLTSFEREVKSVYFKVNGVPYSPTASSVQGQQLIIEFDEQVDPRACSDYTGTNQDVAQNISKFIIMQKQPDETNVTLNYQKQPGLTSDGIIIPVDAPTSLRDEAGNIVKQLKAQNLI